MNKTLVIIAVTLLIGYLIGSSGTGSNSNERSLNYPIYLPGNGINKGNRSEEIRERLENARSNLEDALDHARDVEDAATMRYLNTGDINDMTRIYDAEDAVISIQDALSDLND